MTTITRRHFGALAGAAAAMPLAARAQGKPLSFLSYTYAEEPNKPFVQAILDKG